MLIKTEILHEHFYCNAYFFEKKSSLNYYINTNTILY